MSYASCRDFLRSVWYARVEINRLSLSIKEMEAQAMKVTASLGGTRGGNADAQKLWSRLADDTSKLYARQHSYFDQLARVESFIELVPDARQREILKARYVNCLEWRDVRELLCRGGLSYDERQIYRIHGDALETARKLWEKEKEKYDD